MIKKVFFVASLVCATIFNASASEKNPAGKFKIEDQYIINVCVVETEFSKIPIELEPKFKVDDDFIKKNKLFSFPQSTLILNEKTIIENTTSCNYKKESNSYIKVGMCLNAQMQKEEDVLFTNLEVSYSYTTEIKKSGKNEYPVIKKEKVKTRLSEISYEKWTNLGGSAINTKENGDKTSSTFWCKISKRIK